MSRGKDETKSWKVFTDGASGLSLKYPESLGTKYISTIYWPPKLAISENAFYCAEGGSEVLQHGLMEKVTIAGREYCRTKESEGAAGSIYTTYTYAFPKDGKVFSLLFTLRFVQCDNYDDPNKSECKAERAAFNPDKTLDMIAQSIK